MTSLPFGAQAIGQTEKALNAILDRELRGTPLDERGWVTLTLALRADSDVRIGAFTHFVATSVHIDRAAAQEAIARLAGAGVIEAPADDTARLRVTAQGRELHARVHESIDGITERLWGDLPTGDLDAAGRVLSIVHERAGDELARS